ncbi:MAG: NUDIX domain-containing protein [Gammaproteobacteria bacterium]|nr:NUDIX domain-containing protein [Gammaproteobacteria bacterium]MBI5615241.1 NUDIX domain-containing protein [Gammaproteobacteria bacterium]
MRPAALVDTREPLAFGDAAAAILQTADGRYFLQQRDDKPGIWYPGHWGCFGGGVEAGESPAEALARELVEELDLEVGELGYFMHMDFEMGALGLGHCHRTYYTARLAPQAVGALALREGKDMGAFDARTMLNELDLAPYDAFALFLHASGGRIVK